MKISALVAEFNPLHAGHRLLIEDMKGKSDAIIAVMSGNFVQRGECAVFEKYDRAAAAVTNGVDLVLELPAVYSLSSAEGFAKGAIEILDACNVIDTLHFGSECADIEALEKCAEILNCESPEFSATLTEKLNEGYSYPAARQMALEKIIPEGKILDMPNNILGVEYIRQLKRLNSKIIPFTIKRTGADYNETQTEGTIPSASGIRALLSKNKNAQEYMLYNYESCPVFMNSFDIIVASRLKAISEEELCLLPDCNGEIAVRLKEASVYNTFEEIIESASCRRYTQSRIRRVLCNMIIGNTFKAVPSPTYIRPIAFNKTGSEILRKMKSTASLTVASRGAALKNDSIFNLECRCTDVYSLVCQQKGGREYSTSVTII